MIGEIGMLIYGELQRGKVSLSLFQLLHWGSMDRTGPRFFIFSVLFRILS